MWNVFVTIDRETSKRAGADGMFQVVSLIDDKDNDLTDLVNQGRNFSSLDEVRDAMIGEISKRLRLRLR